MEVVVYTDYKLLYEAEKAHRQQQEVAMAAMRHELDTLKRLIFGSRSERFVPTQPENPSQLSLGMDMGNSLEPAPAGTQQVSYTRTITAPPVPKNQNHPGRMPLPDHLRREDIVLEPAGLAEGAKKIGEEITEELEYTPGELFVNRYIRPKYALPSTDGVTTTVAIAPLPSRPLEKAIAGPALLTWIIISKYADHRVLRMNCRSG